MRRKGSLVLVAVLLVVASCGGGADSTTSAGPAGSITSLAPPSTLASTTTSTGAASTTSQAPTTTSSTTTSTTTTTTTTQPPPGNPEPIITIPVGADGVEYRGSGNEQEIEGPRQLAVDPKGTVHIVDPVALRILSYAGATKSTIDLLPLDILSVMAIAANADELLVVEVFFAPERQRVHRLGYDGTITETIDLPEGFRLEDGLTGVLSDSAGRVILEFEAGSSFGVWDSETQGFERTVALTGGPVRVVPKPPDIEIDGHMITADLSGQFGGMRYLGTAQDGTHVIVRDEVTAMAPAIAVLTTVEWYSASGALLGSASVPSLEDQYISYPPGLAMYPDGRVVMILALEDEVQVIEAIRRPGRITGGVNGSSA